MAQVLNKTGVLLFLSRLCCRISASFVDRAANLLLCFVLLVGLPELVLTLAVYGGQDPKTKL